MVTNITEAKIVWRGMVATYKNMGDRVHKFMYSPHIDGGSVLEARGLYMQAAKTMDRMAKQLNAQFPDHEFDMGGKFVRVKR
jgi:hypothetical protein